MYLLYTAPLAEIIRGHGLDSHIYADDTQLYISFKDCDVDVARLRVDSIMTRQNVCLFTQRTILVHSSATSA